MRFILRLIFRLIWRLFWFLFSIISLGLLILKFTNINLNDITQYLPTWSQLTQTASQTSSNDNYVSPLTSETSTSNIIGTTATVNGVTQEYTAANFGATIILGDVDSSGRPTFAHIQVTDAQEPGQNGIKRPNTITVDPYAWKNFKIDGHWLMDRTHAVGFQFSGINNDTRNLATATAYLNRGTEGSGSDETNTASMLYYEQQLDSWLANHPNYKLDYYVKWLYRNATDKLPYAVYIQWVGIDSNGETLAINIGGQSTETQDNAWSVTLDNISPSYNLDYTTGLLSKK